MSRIGIIRNLHLIGFIILLASALPAMAQKELGIAAIVNNSAISTVDLRERMGIAMFASNLPKGKGFEEKLLPQVLRNLIDERIYLKEAENLGIEISKEDIGRVVADIEKRNGIQPGKFEQYMNLNGASYSSMIDQIRAQLTWNKIIAKKIRPQVNVTDKEIAEKIEYISNQAGAEEANISEILLLVDSENEDKKIKDLANKLIGQLRKGGDFNKIAKQFSKASTAENGGDIGWIRVAQLPDELSGLVKNMQAGEVSDPIKTTEGYAVVKLKEKRTTAALDKDAASNVELKNKIRENLMMKKMEIRANKYLRELRRGAFIEVRI